MQGGRKFFVILTVFLMIFLLSACNDSTEMKIYNHLEEAVSMENEFEDQQGSITELEKEEQEIYDDVITLSMDDFDQIKELAEQAFENIDERHALIETENESLEESKEEVLQTEDLIEKLEDSDLQNKAKEMYETMMNRYEAYADLNEAYLTALKLEKELYEILQDEEADQDGLNEHLDKLNQNYENVIETNELFNEYTANYNELKQDFYKEADLNVDYDEEAANKE